MNRLHGEANNAKNGDSEPVHRLVWDGKEVKAVIRSSPCTSKRVVGLTVGIQ